MGIADTIRARVHETDVFRLFAPHRNDPCHKPGAENEDPSGCDSLPGAEKTSCV